MALLTISDAQIFTWVGQYILPFARIGAFFSVIPIIGAQLVPPRVRLLLAIAITVLVAPMITNVASNNPFSVSGLLLLVSQLLLGVMMGFLVQLFFQVFILAGQMIAMQNGLGFATLLDPMNGVQVVSISQLLIILANLLYLSMNGHLILIHQIVESFQILPMNLFNVSAEQFYEVVMQGSWLFKSALMISLPSIVALLFVNLSIGVMTRVAPQLNIFSIGFPLTMIFGLLVVWIGLRSMVPEFYLLADENFMMIRKLITR